MNHYLYQGKFIKRPYDLAPKGVKSTYQTEKLSFNLTFQMIWKNLIK